VRDEWNLRRPSRGDFSRSPWRGARQAQDSRRSHARLVPSADVPWAAGSGGRGLVSGLRVQVADQRLGQVLDRGRLRSLSAGGGEAVQSARTEYGKEAPDRLGARRKRTRSTLTTMQRRRSKRIRSRATGGPVEQPLRPLAFALGRCRGAPCVSYDLQIRCSSVALVGAARTEQRCPSQTARTSAKLAGSPGSPRRATLNPWRRVSTREMRMGRRCCARAAVVALGESAQACTSARS
jgi:hypothetical protein